ncbi:hypothetical protein JKF63_01075 [Porcisia hertigi]|uniref:Uncharacterized protein n=1 Tax=Porcisia hertigi TaxID=2761500 RepID=A0A836HU10_9TRYP|nr:hypothetical protein JKF63_01075 [Porcisia hertigi]
MVHARAGGMAYAYTDPTSIDYILQCAHDELRRGENQHYRSAEAQYTNHVKELLGNLERYLETCGVRLPAEVREGSKVAAAPMVAGGQESEQAVLGAQQVIQGHCLGGRSAPASVTIGHVKRDIDAVNWQGKAGNNLCAFSNRSACCEWGNLATPCQAERDNGPEITHRVLSRGPIKVPASTLRRAPLPSEQVDAMSDSSSSPLGAAYHHRSAPSYRSVAMTNSDSGVGIFYNTQQATRARAAYPSSSPFMAVDVGTDGSVDSGSAPIVAIIGSGWSSANGARSRECSDSLVLRSPRTPPQFSDHNTGANERGNLYSSGGSGSGSSNIRPTALGATASHDRWGEFGAFVQSVTEMRPNSNMASLESAHAAGCPLPDGVNGALTTARPAAMRNVETSRSGAALASVAETTQRPGVTPRGESQLPDVTSTDNSLTTPPTSVMAAASGGQVRLPPASRGGANAHTSPLPPPVVAQGTGSSAVRALSTAAASPEAGRCRKWANVDADKTLSSSSDIPRSHVSNSPVLQQRRAGEADVGVLQVEYIPSPQQQSRPSEPGYMAHAVVPVHRAAPVPLASQPLYTGGSIGTYALGSHHHTHHDSLSPYPRPSTDGVAVPKMAGTTMMPRCSEKEKLMRRLREVLERSAPAPSPDQLSVMPSAVAQPRRSSLFNSSARSVEEPVKHTEVRHTRAPTSAPMTVLQHPLPICLAGTSVPAAPLWQQTQRMSHHSVPLPNVSCTTSPFDYTNGNGGEDETRTGAWDGSGCPYNLSSKDTRTEPSTFHSVSCGTVQLEEADVKLGGGADRVNSELPRTRHTPMEARHAYRGVGSGDNTATMVMGTPLDDSSAGGEWGRGSRITANSASVRPYTQETVASSFATSLQRHPSSLQVGTSWMRPARNPPLHGTPGTAMPGASAPDEYPPGITNSDIDNGSRLEKDEAQRAHLEYSVVGNGKRIDEQQQSEYESEESAPLIDHSSAPGEKQQLMQRLRMILGRPSE